MKQGGNVVMGMVIEEEVVFSGAGYDVSETNYDEFDNQIESSKLGKKLIQTNSLKGTSRKYQLYANRHLLLSIKEKKNSSSKDFRVDLSCLSPEPNYYKCIPWKWMYVSLSSALLSALTIYLSTIDRMEEQACFILVAIALSGSLISLLIFIYQMRDEYVFKSQYGKAELFVLDNKKPSQQVFDNFFVLLQQTIDNSHKNISAHDRLVNELKMCRRLKDEDVIDDETYINVRTAIFRHEQYKS